MRKNSLFEPCSSLFEYLCSNGCSKQLVRTPVRCPCSKPCSRINPKMPGPCTMLVRGLVRRLFVACTSTFHLRAPCGLVGFVRPCTKWLYEALRKGLFKGLCEVRLNNHWTTQFRCGGRLFERLCASCYTAEVGCSEVGRICLWKNIFLRTTVDTVVKKPLFTLCRPSTWYRVLGIFCGGVGTIQPWKWQDMIDLYY